MLGFQLHVLGLGFEALSYLGIRQLPYTPLD